MSVVDTQKRLHLVQDEVRIAEAFLATLKEKLDKAIAAHRAQIARSLNSKDPDEKKMAEAVATWWSVPKPTSSPSTT